MAQIKKHQSGGTATKRDDSFVEKPVDAAVTPTNQLTFNVDGQEHRINESDFTAIADKAFSNEVRKGNAKLKDRSKWMNVFQTKLQEAKSGRFNVQSSGNAVGNLSYTPGSSDYDASATDGVDASGNASQRSGVGKFIAPKASGSDDYMASVLNAYIGEGVIENRNNLLKTQADKVAADKTSATGKYNDFIKSDAASLDSASLGSLAYGKDWSDPEARKLILNKVWGKEPGYVSAIDSAFQKHVGKVFDPYYDDKLDDYKKAGVDIKGMRDRFSSIYDPTTKSFKVPLKGISDLYRYSDALNTIGSDKDLFDKGSYQSFLAGATPTGSPAAAGTTGPAVVAPANGLAPNNRTIAGRSGDLYLGSDGRYFADKGLSRTVTGRWNDGNYYSSGYLRSGKYAPTEVGLDGKPVYNYNSSEAGYYTEGKKTNQDVYNAYINKISKDPSRQTEYERITRHNQNIDDNYAANNYTGLMTSGFLDDSNITNHGEYAFKGFGSDFKPAAAANISSMFTRGNAPIKGGIYAYQSNNINHLGLKDAETAVVTDDGYNFRGIMKKSADGKFKLYDRNPDNTLKENTDPNLKRFLDGLKADESKLNTQSDILSNVLLNRTRFTPATAESRETASRTNSFLRGVIPGFQIGGRMLKRVGGNDGQQVTNKAPTRYKSTSVANAFKDGYELSTQEKLEAGALLADVTGLGLSLTGAGSVPAALIGGAGTLAQLGADVSRDGLDWGDAGKAAVGFGLDVASAIPGLGLVGKGGKTVNTIKRSAKWLVPALIAYGATQAAGVVTDIVSGKKAISDLNVDDLRALTNGLHAGLGGARMINNKLATKPVTSSELALKKGSVTLEPAQVNALQKLKGEDQLTQAKLFAIENLNKQGKKVSDVELKETRDGIMSNIKRWSKNPKVKEVVDIKTTDTGRGLKDVDDYQSGSLSDQYMRRIIDKAAIRNPNIPADLDGGTRANQWGFWGDYTRGNTRGATPSETFTIPKTTPAALGIPSPSGQPLMGNDVNRISQEATRRDIQDITNWNNLRRPEQNIGVQFNSNRGSAGAGGTGQQTSLFKNGGVIKAQQGLKLGLRTDLTQRNPLDFSSFIPAYQGITTPASLKPVQFNTPISTGIAPAIDMGVNVTGANQGIWSRLRGLANKINPGDVSEFARAMATRNVNRSIDTRVNAPMATAPIQVDVPVKGDLMARNSFYNRANDIITKGGQPQTSDGQLFALQNLEANRQGAFLRAQGDAADYSAIDRSRQIAMQNNMQNNAVRSEVANRNIATLAAARNAERAAENQKIGLVAQPLLTFWENKNAENLRKNAYDKQIDNQIALSGLSTQVNDIKTPLLRRATELFTKSQFAKTEAEKKLYDDQYQAVQKQLEGLGTAATTNALNLRKDLNYRAPGDYYNAYLKPAYAKGGKFEAAFNKASTTAYKERLKDVRNGLKDDAKANDKTMKDIQKLINKALGL